MIIAIDFDGTCVTHEFPKIGKDIGAVPVLKALAAKKHKLILYTMRSNGRKNPKIKDDDGRYLDHAVAWFEQHDIPLYAINANPMQKRWTSSPKIYAKLYIDDAALGCPLIEDDTMSDRPYVDWTAVEQQLIDKGIL